MFNRIGRGAAVAALTLTAALTFAGCAGAPKAKPTPTSTGTFVSVGSLLLSSGPATGDGIGANPDGTCDGMNGYHDIDQGTQVNIYDSAGKIVATGNLETGEGDAYQCSFNFSISDVPRGSKFYQIEVSHRGKITETADAMLQPVRLTLGN